MNKNELISAVAENSGIAKKEVEKVLNSALAAITETVSKGEKVQLIGFGTFELRERAEKQARNPRTGEPMTVAASKAPAFKAGQAFKNAAK